MALGSLVVEVAANVARFQSDMGKVAQIAENEAKRIDRGLGIISTSLKSLGAGFVVGLTFDKIKEKITGTIEAAAGLQKLAERTGATASQLSALAAVAKLSGTDTDALATGLQKLSKATVDAKDGGTKTAAAFAAIGISVADLKGKRPDEIFTLIAQKQALYSDGVEKTAVAQALLGKSGANLLPVMKDIAEIGDLQVKTTDAQAQQALEYEKNLRRLQVAQDAIYKTIALELLPVLDVFTKAMIESATKTDGVRGAVQGLAKDGSIRSWAESAATVIGFVVDAFDGVYRTTIIVAKGIGALWAANEALFSGDFKIAKNILAEFGTEADAILNKTLFSERLAKQFDAARNAKPGETAPRPAPKFNPNSGADTEALLKKILDGRLKAQEDFIADEKKRLQEREQYLDFYAKLEYFTLRDVEEKKQSLIADNLTVTLAAYAKEAAAVEDFIAHAKKQSEAEEGRNKLAEIARKSANAQVEANKAITDSQLKLLEVQRQFDLQTKERARQDDIANKSAQFAIDLMGKSTLEVLKATEARRIQLDLEQRIYELRKKDPNADVSGAIAQAATQTAAATSLIEESYNKQRDAIFGAHEALRKYIEDAGNSGAQVQAVITDSLKGLEDAFTTFFSTGKFGWRQLEQTIVTGINRIIVQEQLMKPIASYLQSGVSAVSGGGGLASFFTSLIGGGGGSGGAVNLGTATGADLSLFYGGFAEGGYIPPGGWGIAGENGEERVYGGKTGVTVMPNGGSTQHNIINITVPGNTTRDTAGQIAVEMRRALAQANRHS